MTSYRGKKGSYQLTDKPLASGGEGEIHSVSRKPGIVAKLYFKKVLKPELERKICFMAANPPDASVLGAIAWPIDVLYDQAGRFAGFVMPKMDTNAELGDIYPYNVGLIPRLSYPQRVIVAINIATVISAIHSAGFVFGDFNPRNIGVNLSSGHVGFFDTDTYHIANPATGETYRCMAGYPGYVAPELIKACKNTDFEHAPLPTFTRQTDLFALAIHIFKLLMNGCA